MYETDRPTPVSSLLSSLLKDVSLIFRKEVELAKTEASEKVSELGKGATSVAIGGALAFAGLLFLLLAATFAIALALPMWAAALIVGGVTLIVGFVIFKVGQGKMRPASLKPERTVRTVRDDIAFARQHLTRG